MKLIFEKSVPGRRGITFHNDPKLAVVTIDRCYLRQSKTGLPEVSELDVVRHFTELSRKNYSIDTGMYPLGSCTMKYNPKMTEAVASLPGFASLHPLLPQLRHGAILTQGALHVLFELEQLLCEITGMSAFTMQPLAGAHGELTGLMLIAAYHKKKGNKKTEVLIPDEAHGTNPSSAAIAGYTVRAVPTDLKTGTLDLAALREMIGPQTAALMLTNPNTLGIFASQIAEIADIVHSVDAQLYYDGANLNAILGRFRPADAHFDVMHINLHKTFATPHGGGGPGAGPVGVRKHLAEFLPVSRIIKRSDGSYGLDYEYPDSIGYIAPFYGNFLICLRAYAYILANGKEGLQAISENAVLNANYLMHQLKNHYHVPVSRTCMHEFVLSAQKQAECGVRAMDIAKALIDKGFHPPTVYFPLIIKEALMIEPTETESKETLDEFIAIMQEISNKAESDPQSVQAAPVKTAVGRLDEKLAIKSFDGAYLIK